MPLVLCMSAALPGALGLQNCRVRPGHRRSCQRMEQRRTMGTKEMTKPSHDSTGKGTHAPYPPCGNLLTGREVRCWSRELVAVTLIKHGRALWLGRLWLVRRMSSVSSIKTSWGCSAFPRSLYQLMSLRAGWRECGSRFGVSLAGAVRGECPCTVLCAWQQPFPFSLPSVASPGAGVARLQNSTGSGTCPSAQWICFLTSPPQGSGPIDP